MINFRIVFFIFLLISSNVLNAQYNGSGFAYPIDRSIVITGNYGELRPNHFHAGLDFSTDPLLNLPIKSVADGYISRIKISSVGYGKVIYVTHPNGYVTVYAHQKKYADKIDTYVKRKQFEQKRNEIELFPNTNELPVKKGEVVGFTGNSGGSTGPHLHFEIREEQTEIPLNPLLFFDVKDNVKPVLTHLAIYDTQDTSNIKTQLTLPVINKAGKLSISKNIIVLPQNTFAIGFSGYDQTNATTNKNNIYDAKISLDGKLIYHHQLNTISFDNGRYVNIFAEKVGALKFQKCFTPSCYDIAIYKTLANGGKIELNDTLSHTVELVVTDEKGNLNHLTYVVKAKHINGYLNNKNKYNAFCNKEFILKQSNFEIQIPKGALAQNTFIHQPVYITAPAGSGIDIGDKNEKLIKPFKMALKVAELKNRNPSKLVMTVNGDVIGGKYENGWLTAESKYFGNFKYVYDTLPPIINCSLTKKQLTTLSGKTSITFTVNDNVSGIGEYAVYINTIWQIAEYDAKSNTITCYFNDETPKGSITIRFEVFDRVANKGILEFKTSR